MAFPSVNIASRYGYHIHIPLHTNTKFSLINNVLHSQITIHVPAQILINPVCSRVHLRRKVIPYSLQKRTRDQQAKLGDLWQTQVVTLWNCSPQGNMDHNDLYTLKGSPCRLVEKKSTVLHGVHRNHF